MLENAIHTRWASLGVADLLPAAKVTTGQAKPRTDCPYASLNQTGSAVASNSNQGTVDDATIQVRIYDDNFDRGKAIVDALKSRTPRGFALDSFPANPGRVIDVRWRTDSYSQTPNGLWVFVIEFMFRHSHPAGAF